MCACACVCVHERERESKRIKLHLLLAWHVVVEQGQRCVLYHNGVT